MKLREHAREIFWKYYQWISRLEYMLFDTQHVEIGPKKAEIAKIAWKLREIAWTRAWNFLKYYQWISQLEYMHFDTQHVEIGPKKAKIANITGCPCWASSNDTSNSQNWLKKPDKSAWQTISIQIMIMMILYCFKKCINGVQSMDSIPLYLVIATVVLF